MQLRHLVIALALTASPSFAELRPEHKALVNRFAALRHEWVNTGLKGPACDEAEGLARQLAAAGICHPAEQNPYYCKNKHAPAQDIGRFHEVANSAAIRPRIDRLIAGQDKWVDFVITKGGVEGPGRVRTIAGRPWRLYVTCRQHACSDQAITMAVSPDNSTVYLYLHGTKQRPTLLGNPPDGVRSALIDMN
ncbi:hypothetical protein AQY21_00395 [Paracoccus sp. MKU1]|nr:hypothetical protein AQY21_00395 [Paracoccus sp. MKU1]